MTPRRLSLWIASAALTILLIIVLVKVGKIDLRVTLQQLRRVTMLSLAELVLLTGLHVYLSSKKWRCVDAALRRPSDTVPSRTMSFALTSIGVALGQVLPVQLSMSIARTVGTYFQGGALRRGTGGTLFEQAFDVLVVVFLAIASGFTRLYSGGGTMWTVCAIALIGLAMVSIGPVVRLVRNQIISLTARTGAPRNRILRSIADIHQPGAKIDGSFGSPLCDSGPDGGSGCESDRRTDSTLAPGRCHAICHHRLRHRRNSGRPWRQ
jgi:hypothetical protein